MHACYLTYLTNLLLRVMYLTCVFMCTLHSHLTFSIGLCFFSFAVNFCFVFVILKFKIFCRSFNWRNRYAQCHSYRDAETITTEVMKVIIYLVLKVCIILWNLLCSIRHKSYFYFIPRPFINHFFHVPEWLVSEKRKKADET